MAIKTTAETMTETTVKTTIVIPQKNRWELTAACVSSLFRFLKADARFEIVVVDDGSLEAERKWANRYFAPVVRFVKNEGRGISSAWNCGAALACTESRHLVFLNNDIVCRGDFLSGLIAPLSDEKKIMTGVRWRRETMLSEGVLKSFPTRMFLEGWCFAVRKQDFECINGFDERMQLYWSDTDFQLRLWKQFGNSGRSFSQQFVAVAQSKLHHLGHQSTQLFPERRRQWEHDRSLFLQRWRGE